MRKNATVPCIPAGLGRFRVGGSAIRQGWAVRADHEQRRNGLEALIAATSFTEERQTAFAALSGDWNPVHIDAVAARRTQAGAPIVHGMHTVACCLDAVARRFPTLGPPASLKATFVKPVYVGDPVEFVLDESRSALGIDVVRLRARVQGITTVRLRLRCAEGQPKTASPEQHEYRGIHPSRPPREISPDEIAQLSGMIDATVDSDVLKALFPDAVKWLGTTRLSGLISISTLVGMECPGLHSMIAGVDVTLETQDSDFSYRVVEFDERIRRVDIEVQGSGLRGQVDAFLSPPPAQQKSIVEICTRVKPDEFRGHSALIVGGSRGLGELTAKTIAAGGGCPIITYHRGEKDAERVADEIRRFGSSCRVLPYDARRAAAEQLKTVCEVRYVYYFATDRIFGQHPRAFDPALFRQFLDLYVDGFFDLCEFLSSKSGQTLRVFYPSSTALDDRPQNMTEYAMAKSAAEVLCADLNGSVRAIKVVTHRLPRLATDQTLTVMPSETNEAIDVLLPVIRQVQTEESR